jgi:hypothetical protein
MTVQEEFNQFKGGIRLNDNKLRYDLCPAIAQREYAKVWTEGLKKYPARNWEKGFLFSEVIASAM